LHEKLNVEQEKQKQKERVKGKGKGKESEFKWAKQEIKKNILKTELKKKMGNKLTFECCHQRLFDAIKRLTDTL